MTTVEMGYSLFTKKICERLEKIHPGLSKVELSKIIGTKWDGLSVEQKKFFNDEAEKINLLSQQIEALTNATLDVSPSIFDLSFEEAYELTSEILKDNEMISLELEPTMFFRMLDDFDNEILTKEILGMVWKHIDPRGKENILERLRRKEKFSIR